MKKMEIIQYLIDFVDGAKSFDEFMSLYENDTSVKDLLNDNNPGKIFSCFRNSTVDEHMHLYDWKTRRGRNVVHLDIVRYLKYYGYDVHPTTKYENDYVFLLDIQPRYVNIADEQFLQSFIDSAPKDRAKAQQKAWLKEQIKSLFRYDKTPPRWIQDPEWPIVDGKPLVFSHQKKAGKDDERTYYYFYDPETGNQTIITQFY